MKINYYISNVNQMKHLETPPKDSTSKLETKNVFSTPVIIIISVSVISIILIVFLYCFYKNL